MPKAKRSVRHEDPENAFTESLNTLVSQSAGEPGHRNICNMLGDATPDTTQPGAPLRTSGCIPICMTPMSGDVGISTRKQKEPVDKQDMYQPHGGLIQEDEAKSDQPESAGPKV